MIGPRAGPITWRWRAPLIDMEAGARVSGSRFAYLRGDVVLLEMALFRWALGVLGEHGFEPVIPPVLVREEALYGTGFLPDTEQQIYRLADDDLYLVGTSEVPLASLHAGEILDAGSLPKRYAGMSPCFRREAGAAGRDTRGILRVHQFDKVEMFSFVEPEAAGDEHELLLSLEERFLRSWGSRTAWSTSAPTTSARRRPRSTTSRPGCPGRSATARSRRPPTRPTSSRAGSTSAIAIPAAGHGTSTRSTAPPSPGGT